MNLSETEVKYKLNTTDCKAVTEIASNAHVLNLVPRVFSFKTADQRKILQES